MIFYKKNLIPNIKLLKIKTNFLIFLTLISVIQIFISNFNTIDTLITLIILFTTYWMMEKIFNKKYIVEFFIPFLIVFYLNWSYLSGPLILKTFFFQNLTSNFFLPIETFIIAIIFQILLVLVLLFFESSIKLNKISTFISNKIIYNLKGYVVLNRTFLYFLLLFLFINRLYLNVIDQGVNSFTEYGNISMKLLYGFNLFYFLPLIHFFYLFQVKEISKGKIYFIFFIYILSGFFFAITGNSRTQIFLFFFYLLFFVNFFKIFIFENYSTTLNFKFFILIIFILIIGNKLSQNITEDRIYRSDISAMELFKLSTGERLEGPEIEHFLGDESLVGNPIADRLISIKFLDKSLYYSKDFNKSQKKYFKDFINKRFLFILPQNLTNIFDKEYIKEDYAISSGSLVERTYYGYDKGGLKTSGNFLAELMIIFDSYIVICLLIFIMFLIVFIITQSFQKKNPSSNEFSPLIIVLLIGIVNVINADSLMGILSFTFRTFSETIFLNFIIILIYLNFFKKNENISNR